MSQLRSRSAVIHSVTMSQIRSRSAAIVGIVFTYNHRSIYRRLLVGHCRIRALVSLFDGRMVAIFGFVR